VRDWLLRVLEHTVEGGRRAFARRAEVGVTASTALDLLPDVQEDMIHRALELADVTCGRSWFRVRHFSLPRTCSREAMGRVVEEQHSRVPVYDPKQGPEHIIGVLYSRTSPA